MRLYTSLALVLVLAGCSDNSTNPADAGPDGGLDGNLPDVAVDAPVDAPQSDAADAATTSVSGTVAVTDVTLVDPSAAAVGGINGGSISISFENTSDGAGGTVVSGTSPINDCVVTKFDPTHKPHAQLDASGFTIANSPANENPATGLLKTVGPCTDIPQAGGYVCISNNDTNKAVTAVGTNGTVPGSVTFQFTTPFTGEKLVGSYLTINGFNQAHYNSGASAFPIIAQPDDSTLIVIDPAGTADAVEAATTGISDTVLNGYNPVPAAGPASADFLGTGSISMDKAANTVWPAISFTVDVPGQGWTLSDPGDPTNLPLTGTAANLAFGCANGTPNNPADDTCGDGTTAALKVMVLSGRATKKSLAGLAPFQMPTEVPGTDTWLEFQCAFLGTHSATLTAAAGQAIIDFAPTRVELRVINAAGTILQNGSDTTNVLVGHGIVGHTTHP